MFACSLRVFASQVAIDTVRFFAIHMGLQMIFHLILLHLMLLPLM